MSAKNVELARRGYDALSRGDLEAIAPLLAPDVRWHGGDPEAPGACRNRAEALQFMHAARQRGVVQLLDVIDAGERVVVILQPPADPGGELPPPRANITTFRDGRVIEMVAYESPEAALKAAGLALPDDL